MMHGVPIAARAPQPVHPEKALPLPLGDRELLEQFLSLHDHAMSGGTRLDPDAEAMRWWLRHEAGLPVRAAPSDDDVAWALAVRDAFIDRLEAGAEGRPDPQRTDRILDEAIGRSGLVPQCTRGKPPFRVTGTGVGKIVGQILATAFTAELEGTWDRFRICANPECRAVFFDRSKNRSGKWCSMRWCGNQHKVRAFRRRQVARS